MNNMQELEEMRSALASLKNKLDKQEIVNDRLLRQSMKSKMSWIKRYLWISLCFIPIVAVCFLPMTIMLKLSWWLYGFTILFVAGCVIADWYVNHMDSREFLTGNLTETAYKLRRMKTLRMRNEIVSCSVLVLWIVWMAWEIYTKGQAAPADSLERGMSVGGLIGGGIGLVIGGVIGLSIFFKMQRTNDEIIQQIEEITGEQTL